MSSMGRNVQLLLWSSLIFQTPRKAAAIVLPLSAQEEAASSFWRSSPDGAGFDL